MSYLDFDFSEEDPSTWLDEPVIDYDGNSWDPEDNGFVFDEDSRSYVKLDD